MNKGILMQVRFHASWIAIILFMIVLFLPYTSREGNAPVCPRCGHPLTLSPLPPEPRGESDWLLCRWDLQSENPYVALFITCSHCGLTFLRESLPIPQDWLEGLEPPESIRADEPFTFFLTRLSNAFAFYRNPRIPIRTRIKAAWAVICALHRQNFVSGDPRADVLTQQAFGELKYGGLNRWPLWRWYESLGYYFSQTSSHQPVLAAEFLRRIGDLNLSQKLLKDASPKDWGPTPTWAVNIDKAMELEVRIREEILELTHTYFVGNLSRCVPIDQSLAYIELEIAYQFKDLDRFMAILKEFRACKVRDPLLEEFYIVNLIRRAWLEHPSWREKLDAWLGEFS